MFGTMNCTYETPCGWCVKWDKKCDKKIKKKEKPYADLFKPCYDCVYNHFDTSQCKECTIENGFKHFVQIVHASVLRQLNIGLQQKANCGHVLLHHA